MKKFLDKSWLVTRYLFLRTFQEGFSDRAASLAYTTLLAIVPILFVIFKLLSFFPIFEGVWDQLQNFIVKNFVAATAHVVSQHLHDFIKNVQNLPNSSILFLLVLDLFMLYSIHAVFRDIWHGKSTRHMSLFFLLYLVILFLSPFAFGLLLISASFLYKLAFISKLVTTPYIHQSLLILLPYLLTLITFTIFNWILPAARVRFIHAFIGGLITTIIFEIAKYVFTLYLSHFSTYRLVYGALAILPIFLVWLYVSWLIILLGAMITNLIAVGIPKRWQTKLKVEVT
jgi:membrane protein